MDSFSFSFPSLFDAIVVVLLSEFIIEMDGLFVIFDGGKFVENAALVDFLEFIVVVLFSTIFWLIVVVKTRKESLLNKFKI